jgi:hypothetical protein
LDTSTAQASVPECGGARLLAAEHGVEHGRVAAFLQRAELLAAPADHRRGGRHHAGEQALLAVRREGHLEGALLGHGGQRVELELEPLRIVGAHVHRQRLGHRRQAARLLGAVDPDLEGQRLAEQPMSGPASAGSRRRRARTRRADAGS